MKVYKIVNNLEFGSILLQTILWIILTVITFGLALPFFLYYFVKLILNTTEIHEIVVEDSDNKEQIGFEDEERKKLQEWRKQKDKQNNEN